MQSMVHMHTVFGCYQHARIHGITSALLIHRGSSTTQVEELRREMGEGVCVTGMDVDVSSPASVARLASRAEAHFGAVDVWCASPLSCLITNSMIKTKCWRDCFLLAVKVKPWCWEGEVGTLGDSALDQQ